MVAAFDIKRIALVLSLCAGACSIYEPALLQAGGSDASGGDSAVGGSAAQGGTAGTAGDDAKGGTDAGSGASAGSAGSAGADQTLPFVTGSSKVPPIAVNLTRDGSRDWEHWGLVMPDDRTQKAGVASQLQDFTALGNATPTLITGGPITFSWTDGDPVASGSSSNAIAWKGVNEGFKLTTLAADEERRVRLYVGVTGGTAELKAMLDDPRATNHVEDHYASPAKVWNIQQVTIEYGFADKAETQLEITWKVVEAVDATAAVSLAAATFDAP